MKRLIKPFDFYLTNDKRLLYNIDVKLQGYPAKENPATSFDNKRIVFAIPCLFKYSTVRSDCQINYQYRIGPINYNS